MRSVPSPATSAPPMTGSACSSMTLAPSIPSSARTAGTELTIVGQVVAPFLLTGLLMPALVTAAASRLITVWAHLAAATAPDTSKAGAGRAGQRGCCSVISPWGQG